MDGRKSKKRPARRSPSAEDTRPQAEAPPVEGVRAARIPPFEPSRNLRNPKNLTTKSTKVTKERKESGHPNSTGLAGECKFARCMRRAHADISSVVREQQAVLSPQRVLNPSRLVPFSSSCSLCPSWLILVNLPGVCSQLLQSSYASESKAMRLHMGRH